MTFTCVHRKTAPPLRSYPDWQGRAIARLNDGFEGGATAFDFDKVVPEQGMALFFLHSLPHCGEPVIAGRKYVLRSDIMYARQ